MGKDARCSKIEMLNSNSKSHMLLFNKLNVGVDRVPLKTPLIGTPLLMQDDPFTLMLCPSVIISAVQNPKVVIFKRHVVARQTVVR